LHFGLWGQAYHGGKCAQTGTLAATDGRFSLGGLRLRVTDALAATVKGPSMAAALQDAVLQPADR
jgi:hypothetical protein